MPPIRLAVRALILNADHRLLLVNAFPDAAAPLWVAPGGGIEPGEAIEAALIREVAEETGLTITPGPLALIGQFHDEGSGFHQVDLFFRATIACGSLRMADPAGVVHAFRWISRADLAGQPHAPTGLADAAWAAPGPAILHPLEAMIRPA
ncbi:NUDIX domain-containing protein [Paracoccus sp. p4-l81]|uniref:NUDIX domain-containing protein n=1 Tax=unclassified Paracoccus (in: a-proteobacteria) TaxID=2688777 RepID=UPI0035BB1CB0